MGIRIRTWGWTLLIVKSLDVIHTDNIDGLVKVYPDGGHAIADPESHAVSKYFFDDLVEFIRQESSESSTASKTDHTPGA